MRSVLASLLAGVLVSASTCPQVFAQTPSPTPAPAAPAPAWATYPQADLRYAVDFPAKPARSDSKVDTAAGPVPSSFVGAQLGSQVFGVTTGDYSTVGGVVDPNATAQRAMDGSVAGRTVLSSNSFSVASGAGRETVSEGGGLVVRIRVYVVASRVHIVMAGTLDTAHPQAVKGADAERFFASFHPQP